MKEGTKFDLWNWKQPQLISLIITVLIIFIFSITIYLKVRKTKANKASKGIVQIAEAYVGMVEANFESVAGPTKIKPAKIYIFTLGTFLLVGNLVVLFGFEPIVTSYSVPFTLAIFTWFGVMLVGTIYEKLKFYRKLLIPTELIGKLSIIVSLSLRIYGNIIGGSAILASVYLFAGFMWQLAFSVPSTQSWYFFGLIITPFLHFYFDLFGSVIQALVFSLLTTVYWVMEAESTKKKKKVNSTTERLSFKNWSRKNKEAIY
ncbi:F0F1 ATP synthase subunit A [Mycoplasmopsis cynos]|uniref:ATP synthase, A subunit n=3 Tax=Mycoplasmopsis cynos TaxID=171284 RepID=L0RWR0_MYCC1|nr:F0F1 ATP synthase subunit A [Mycoplasmopsis cynos]TQC54886.1 F0F1 ATP synthase subunit A [Mycoplasmopsis cynos]WQQ15041.1 F0F1 ATP synthase subunit A [Mycoplasmopsis cynos]WQQ15448.1 F0F1 ATP synthase subunit A [Mycoplasmopsis cynos]WQQ17945.1 F0F1 ATP synthase subunit A [Mycoplasmopsis cynos]WQQ18123.1 F0F1 ATP synthase subunit A [Mycoplasmopsis cynos]